MSPRPYLYFQVALTLFYLFGHLITPTLGQLWTRIDDTDPGIHYSPNWLQGPCGDPCLNPDPTVWNGTWHVTWTSTDTGSSSFTYTYTGYSVVIGAVLDDQPADNVSTTLIVNLDGQSTSITHTPNPSGGIETGAVIYNSLNTPLGTHTITVYVEGNSFFGLDYIGYQLPPDDYTTSSTGGNTGGNSGTPSSTSQQGSSPTSSATTTTKAASTTSQIVITGPSGTTTIATTIALPASNGSTFDPSTLTGNNILAHTLAVVSTSTDASGHSFIVPISTYTGDDPAFTRSNGNSNGRGSTDVRFSPALAGAIGAAVAAISAVVIVVIIFLCKRRSTRRLRTSGGAEPYILAASATPSSATSSLSPPLSPMPYSPQSALGLFVGPTPIPDHQYPHPHLQQQQFDLLASPPPNTLSTPLSPNQPYSYPVTHKIISSSNSRGLTPRRQTDMTELRSPITPVMIQRPNDWDIEGYAGIGAGAGMVHTPTTPLTGTPSPIVTTPTSYPSRRRSGRQKELLEPPSSPPPPVPNVPVLRQPNVPRRSRRADIVELPNLMPNGNGNEDGRRDTGSGIGSDEESLPPVLRRQSLTHPAPPAYSPPRLVRNADLHFEQ